MIVEKLVVGLYEENCYFLWKGQDLLLVDPGAKPQKILNKIKEKNGNLVGILLTHGHFDHIGAVDDILKEYPCEVYMNELDEPLLQDVYLNCSNGFNVRCNANIHYLQEGMMKIKDFEFEVIDAPGHSEGSCLFLFEDCIFAGDVLFKGSIGRTDFPRGSNSKLRKSLHLFFQFNPKLTVYSGHGEKTTIEQELNTNPFLKNL